MDREKLFLSLRDAVVNELHKTYKQIAAEHDVCIATVQQVAGILKKETGFSRPKGRPLGSGKGKGIPIPVAEHDSVPNPTKTGMAFYDALKISKDLMREQDGATWWYSIEAQVVWENRTDIYGRETTKVLTDVRPEQYDDWDPGSVNPADPPGWLRARIHTVWPPKSAAEDKKWDFFVAYPGDAVSTEFVVDAETREEAVIKIRGALLAVGTIIEEHPTYSDEQMEQMRVKAGRTDLADSYGNGEI